MGGLTQKEVEFLLAILSGTNPDGSPLITVTIPHAATAASVYQKLLTAKSEYDSQKSDV